MSIRTLILGAVALAGTALPGVASAQGYGRGYDAPVYAARGHDRFDDRGRGRWEERRYRHAIERRRARERAHRHHARYDHRDYRDY